ncbi:MAG: hypothetical protein GY906_02920 [bacterium]|nr:hypothetical protein [bacterium]
MRGRDLLVLSALAFATVPPTEAQESPKLEISVRTDVVTVGDVVQVSVQARGGRDLNWGELEVAVTDQGPWALVQQPRSVAASRPPAWDVLLAPMKLGELELPEFQVTVRSADGAVARAEVISLPSVQVETVLPPDQETAPSPMRQPVGVHGFPWEWVAPAAIVLLPFMMVGVWMMQRARSKHQTGVMALAPLEELELRMAKLTNRVGKDPGEFVCDQLAAGLRCYLERRSGEPVGEMTTFEMRVLARSAGWPEPVQRGMAVAMDAADGVRFGKRAVSDSGLRSAIDSALATGRGFEAHVQSLEQESSDNSQAVVA